MTTVEIFPKQTKGDYWNETNKWKWTINLCVGSVLLFSTRNSMAVCVPAISKELAWNKEISGMALSSFFFGYVGSNIVGGYFADRFGGAKTILYSSLIWSSLTFILPHFANSQGIFISGNFDIFAIRFLTGCSQGFFYPSFVALISRYVRTDDKGFVVGIVYSGCAIGIILTGFFGSLLIEAGHWSYVFMISGFSSLLWLIWFRNLSRETIQQETVENFNSGSKSTDTTKFIKSLLCQPSIWALLIAYFGSGCTYAVLNSWTPVYFHDVFPNSKGWVFNVIPWLTSFIFELVTGYYANGLLKSGKSVLFVRKTYAAILFIGTALFSVLLTKVKIFEQALLLMSLVAGFSAFGSSSISMNPQDVCPNKAGSLFGLSNAIASFGGTIGVYLTGLVLETNNNWSLIFICNAIISILSFLVFQLFGSTKPIDNL
ncbi:voltage-gated purine nucleotide uniporter SLC17A9-like [Clytia hemisphaerica]|uniref:voltage-gated purine nucleotide uniporter SLC17A9-like n=1 Tax=Clytia hemisphaerica TaxID=252671 RepID=UPI0034D61B7A